MAQTKIMNENGFSNDEIFYQDFFRTKEKIEHEIEIIDISNDDDNDDTDIKYNATANLNDRIKELEKQLKFKDLKIKILEDKQNLDINDKLKLKIELDAIKEAFQKLKNENNQIKSEKIDVNEINSIRIQNTSLHEKLENHLKENEKLVKEKDTFKAEIESLKDEVKKLKELKEFEQNRKLQSIKYLDKTNQKLRNKLKRSESNLTKLRSAISRVAEDRDALVIYKNALKDHIIKLEIDLGDSYIDYDNLRTSSEATISHLQVENFKLREENEKLAKNKRLLDEIDSLTNALKHKNNLLNGLRIKSNSLQKEMDANRDAFLKKSNELRKQISFIESQFVKTEVKKNHYLRMLKMRHQNMTNNEQKPQLKSNKIKDLLINEQL